MLPPALIPLTWLGLLLRYPARTLAIGVPILTVLGSIAIWLIIDERANQQRLDRLEMDISYAPNTCSPDTPILVQIRNNSDRALKDLKWRIAAYRPGESINLVQTLYAEFHYSSASPLAPNTQWQSCQPLPTLRPGYRASTLEFRIERRQGQFIR
ncbi:multidrug transporter [Denitrificimonas sp. JX-1]|uniref:Multidrug transporter n=1 Tax=Denitrificimonas halotolerans TaxID=3098930 RepID=A0ABU5GTD2_9GAMM|nr:multidrug transporter [Denitrificimonas sp. JX-1]MDY7218893.1 multidrug transporter [Denitrificimonas sp. JX-1]